MLFRSLLRSKAYLDYSSILEEAVACLRDDPRVRAKVGGRIRFAIVDEYQDVNPIQEALVRQLHDLGASVCVVGDDDQTIYQWRGSDVANIVDFQTRYPRVRSIRLEENFRSSAGITDVAKIVISRNAGRLEKEMVSANTQRYEQGDIAALAFDSVEAEATHIEIGRAHV